MATNGRRIEDVGTSHTEPEAVGVVHREDASGSKIDIRSEQRQPLRVSEPHVSSEHDLPTYFSSVRSLKQRVNNFFELDAAVVKSSVIHKAVSHLRQLKISDVHLQICIVSRLLFLKLHKPVEALGTPNILKPQIICLMLHL
nr:hypothetical protein [Tanacetum cinerariifolium]